MDYQTYFANKKITVMGLGVLGRGVGDVIFLAEQGTNIIVTDIKTKIELKDSIEKLKKYKNISFTLGSHRLEDFKGRDLIIKGAGVPFDSIYIKEAERNHIPIRMSAALFAQFSPATIVGVTGTRGKSTVTQLIFEILKKAGKKVFLGGNVRGVSTLAHLPDSTSDEIAVLELDSWQLQGFAEIKKSPHIAVFTTFMADHMNYYHNDMDRYLDDKAAIFKFQTQDDILVLGAGAAEAVWGKYKWKARLEMAHAAELPSDWNTKLLGDHNKENSVCAIEAVRALGIKEDVIKETVEEFAGVEGRLQYVREVRGVKIYNDTNATTPDATIVGLEALHQHFFFGQSSPHITLIMGGNDKSLPMRDLVKKLDDYCNHIILLPGTGTDILDLPDTLLKIVIHVKNLKEAVKQSLKVVEKGDIILLSPAFSSFGQFVNEYDRGEQFLSFVKKL